MSKTRILTSASIVALYAASTLSAAQAQSMDALIKAAKEEGQLTTIALPHDWCGYGELIDSFKAKYGLRSTSSTPMPAPATRSRRSRPTRAIPARRRRT